MTYRYVAATAIICIGSKIDQWIYSAWFEGLASRRHRGT